MSMDVEVSVAWNYVISYLYNKLPRRRVDCFGEALESGLKRKFEGHWYPDKPFRGSAFRCVKVSGAAADPVIEAAANQCGISIEEVHEFLPPDLTIWIDPKEVSYRIGEKGVVKILYSTRQEEFSCQVIDCELTLPPETQAFKPINTLSTSLGSLNLSPVDAPTNLWRAPSPTHLLQSPSIPPVATQNPFQQSALRTQLEQKYMTAAMFAQTKFGSTKLKSNAKRPNRLSPTEFSGYVQQPQQQQQRPPPQSHWINGVGAVSPAGAASYQAVNGFPAPGMPYVGAPPQLQPSLVQVRGDAGALDARQGLINQHMMMLQQHHLQQQVLQQSMQSITMASELPNQTTPLPANHPSNQSSNQTLDNNTLNMTNGYPHHAINSPTTDYQHMGNHSTEFHNNNNNTVSPHNDYQHPSPPVDYQPPQSNDYSNHQFNHHTMAHSTDLGLEGIMSRIAASACDDSDCSGAQVSSSHAPAWPSNVATPYASLQHLLVAN